MDDMTFHQLQLDTFAAFSQRVAELARTQSTLVVLADQFHELANHHDRVFDEAPELVARFLTTAPQYAPEFPRDLLWYLGSACLHFMPDEEIDRFRELDEARLAAAQQDKTFNWREAIATPTALQ